MGELLSAATGAAVTFILGSGLAWLASLRPRRRLAGACRWEPPQSGKGWAPVHGKDCPCGLRETPDVAALHGIGPARTLPGGPSPVP